MKSAYAVRRTLAVLVMAAAITGLLALRVLVTPEIEAYRAAMAPAPEGGLYAALAGRRFLQVGPDGGVRFEWRLPAGTPLSLAASGDNLLLGTDRGLHLSVNRGRTWDRVISTGRFLATAIRGDQAFAGAWADRLWSSHDGGQTWAASPVPAGDTEFESIAIGPSSTVVATVLGAFAGSGAGAWERTSLPARMTAVDVASGSYLAGEWRGRLYGSPDGLTWQAGRSVEGGIWSVSGARSLAATTQGLFSAGGRPAAFQGREVSAVVASDGSLYAAIARGPIMVSNDGGDTWRLAVQR